MAHTVANSTGNFLSTPGVPCLTKNNFVLRHNFTCKVHRKLLLAERYRLPLSTSLNLFPQFRPKFVLQPRGHSYKAFASGTDVAIEEPEVSQVDVEAANGTETTGESSEKPKADTPRVKRSKPARKSDMPPVKNEELVPGATFTGKVRSIQPFGAFVDFGAFTDGLVHVSQLSDSFVKDVANIVTVGQEVKVRLLEANMDSGRISLSMREKDESSKQQQQRSAPVNGDKSRPPRKTGPRNTQKKDEVKKISKFVKGQDLLGAVKNLTRAGAFISLPEGEEGFLPTSEEADEGFISMTTGASSLEIGQEVNVRVLRITRGQITLTMKKEEDAAYLGSNLNQGVVHRATNPFALAFHNNKEISSFLDERKKSGEDADISIDGLLSPVTAVESTTDEVSSDAPSIGEEQGEEHDSVLPSEAHTDSSFSSESFEEVIPQPLSFTSDEEAIQSAADIESDVQENEEPTLSEGKEDLEIDISAQTTLSTDISEEATGEAAPVSSSENDENSQEPDLKPSSETEVASSSIEDSSLAIAENESESVVDITNEPLLSETQEETVDLKVEDQDEATESSSDATPLASSGPGESNTASPENDPSSIEAISLESSVDGENTINAVQPEASLDEGKTLESPEQAEPVAVFIPEATQKGAASAISPALVKQLREETGAGMMDCKKALSETGGDIVKAQEYLRKKGLASADKKASRATAEGRIGSYIHDSRIGVLIEVNCETDFVSRGDIFKELAEDLAMQVAACPQVEYVNVEDIPAEIVEKEREIEMQKEDLLSKPEQIRSKIVDGRISKRLGELTLLEQPFIKDDKVLVKDWVKQTISTIGENMKVKRFVRYNLGEGLQKKNIDFAAEVAAQTAAKSNPVVPAIQDPAATETKEAVESTEKVAVSAALVKQLREETGAGMMDCKKALSETGGDFEKAQEYLRKKGLSAADKKSSRIAAEGRIGSYIHDSRIGVLVELNCETDFVGRSQAFKELVDDLAMQAVACPQVQYVSIEDIPQSIVDKEKQLEMQREDLQSKPENIREKIVEGRITKRLGELALLEQPFIKNDSLLVKDLVKQTVAALGENIKVRRFARFTLGETAKIEA